MRSFATIRSMGSISLRFFNDRDQTFPKIGGGVLAQSRPAGGRQRLAEIVIGPDLTNAYGNTFDRFWIHENSGISGLLANAADIGCDHGTPESPSLKNR